MTTTEPHMTWCVGEHDDEGYCVVSETVSDMEIGVAGMPGGGVTMYVAGSGYDAVWPADLQPFMDTVTRMRNLVVASEVETTAEWFEQHWPTCKYCGKSSHQCECGDEEDE